MAEVSSIALPTAAAPAVAAPAAAGVATGTTGTTWKLIAPDYSGHDTIWRNPRPFILWHVGNQPLLGHWMDEAVRRGASRVEVYVAEQPAAVRAWLEGGAFWSRQVDVIPIASEADAPAEAERMTGLPLQFEIAGEPGDPMSLLRHWFALQKIWLTQRTKEAAALDAVHASGGWVGPGARVDPTATLTAPFWVGAGAQIGAGCRIGPNAFVSRGAIVDEDVEIENAFIATRTYVGKHTRVADAIATGDALVDMKRGERVPVREDFILSHVIDESARPSFPERLLALGCLLVLAPFAAAINGRRWRIQRAEMGRGEWVELRTGENGPLWARRWRWLQHVVTGHLRWVGPLPRAEEDWAHVPGEHSDSIRASRPGLLSLADVYGCHSPEDPEEWIHASYQVHEADPGTTRLILRNLWKIAWSRQTPGSSTTAR